MNEEKTIAYFSMEIGLDPEMPTYSGGLGILAGDTLRSAADLKVPMIAVTLLYRKGYFYQRLDDAGRQREEPVHWIIEDYLEEMSQRASVVIEGRTVQIRPWRYEIEGIGGFKVPVYFLDVSLPENSEWDRTLTDFLYGGDQHYRLCQEVILGIGGVRALRSLGYMRIERFHMNEGHASLLTLELLNEEAKKDGRTSIAGSDIEAVKEKCVFTTHTPVPAGHDQFPLPLVRDVLRPWEGLLDTKDRRSMDLERRVLRFPGEFHDAANLGRADNALNMTYLALNLSHYVNGVAKKHGDISRLMFAEYTIDAITNGVHAATWTAGAFQKLYDRQIPGWRQDNFNLRYALSIPKQEVWNAHAEIKKELIDYINRETNIGMGEDVLTIGYARRAAAYKRADLLFTDIERLKSISSKAGPFQVVYAGKAHPQDQDGKEVIKRIFQAKEALRDDVRIAYMENYDMELGRMTTSGVDVWLNTPQPPLEASGTSGMKAALNGVPSLSVLDGWWIEGCIEGVTGWSIGEDPRSRQGEHDASMDAASLYDKLEKTIIPLFYRDRARFIDVMLHCIALNGSFFNTNRMLQQYVLNAYFL
jgi:starch phosphorylase